MHILKLDALRQRIADFERSHNDQLVSKCLFRFCWRAGSGVEEASNVWRGCCFGKAGALELVAGHDATRARSGTEAFRMLQRGNT
jgi:hypothetical protein